MGTARPSRTGESKLDLELWTFESCLHLHGSALSTTIILLSPLLQIDICTIFKDEICSVYNGILMTKDFVDSLNDDSSIYAL